MFQKIDSKFILYIYIYICRFWLCMNPMCRGEKQRNYSVNDNPLWPPTFFPRLGWKVCFASRGGSECEFLALGPALVGYEYDF